MKMKTVLTIAGSDSSGGAGIQADIKTITAHGLYASSAVTALTAQNTTGVYGIMEATPEFLASQLDCVFQDIFPDAVKIGMVSSAPLIKVIAAKLKEYQARHIVVESGDGGHQRRPSAADDAADTLIRELIPLAQVITPNIPEGEVLCGFSIETPEDMERAAKDIAGKAGTAVLLKGGHELNDAMISCVSRDPAGGFGEKGLIIPIPTAPAVLCLRPSPADWRRDCLCGTV